jgi:hypothetical protein
MATLSKAKRAEQAEAIEKLRIMLPPGSMVKTILRHCSRSGMSRSISPIVNGEDVGYLVALAIDERRDPKNGGIKLGGCGMDMGFQLVYLLARTSARRSARRRWRAWAPASA